MTSHKDCRDIRRSPNMKYLLLVIAGNPSLVLDIVILGPPMPKMVVCNISLAVFSWQFRNHEYNLINLIATVITIIPLFELDIG